MLEEEKTTVFRNRITAYTMEPMYFITQKNTIEMIPHAMSNLEIVRVYDNAIDYYDIPVNETMTLIPLMGLVLFRGNKLVETFAQESTKTLIINGINSNKRFYMQQHDKYFYEDNNTYLDSGIYCLDEFDINLPYGCETFKDNLCYINGSKEICKPKQIKTTDHKIEIFVKYIERNKSIIEKLDITRTRLLFEVVCDKENGVYYINHFTINSYTRKPVSVIYFTKWHMFPIFADKIYANFYIRDGEYEEMLKNISYIHGYSKYAINKQLTSDMYRKIFGIVIKQVSNYKKEIFEFAASKALTLYHRIMKT